MNKTQPAIWSLLFILVILLSQDYVFFDWDETQISGFSKWMGWFIFVQLLFLFLLYWFSNKYWKE